MAPKLKYLNKSITHTALVKCLPSMRDIGSVLFSLLVSQTDSLFQKFYSNNLSFRVKSNLCYALVYCTQYVEIQWILKAVHEKNIILNGRNFLTDSKILQRLRASSLISAPRKNKNYGNIAQM